MKKEILTKTELLDKITKIDTEIKDAHKFILDYAKSKDVYIYNLREYQDINRKLNSLINIFDFSFELSYHWQDDFEKIYSGYKFAAENEIISILQKLSILSIDSKTKTLKTNAKSYYFNQIFDVNNFEIIKEFDNGNFIVEFKDVEFNKLMDLVNFTNEKTEILLNAITDADIKDFDV